MKEEKIKRKIRHALRSEDAVITNVKRTPGGLTNISYFATINDERYVVRIAGKGTGELIDRQAEKSNLIFGTELNINPELIYFDVSTGMKITKEIQSATPLTPSLARESHTMKHIISLFQHLHHSEKSMENQFKLFHLHAHYEDLVMSHNPFVMETLLPLKEDLNKLRMTYESFQVEEAPCHIDSACSNLILSSNDELYLIDWEYSGMFDPLWDIATLFLSFQFTEEEEKFFLTYYLEREPHNVELQRILMHMIFQDYLWGLWTIYKEAIEDEASQDGIARFERAKENIIRYKLLFQEDVVV